METFDPHKFTKLANGNYVQKDVLNIAQRVYDEFGEENVRILYLEGDGALGDTPWVICEWVEATQSWEKIFGVWELNETVLQVLRELDSRSRHAVDVMKQLERMERKMREEPKERYEEWRKNEAIPLMAAAFRSDKTFTFKNDDGEIVKLHG